MRHLISDDDNMTGEFQGRFRVGNFDADLIEHAIQVNGGLDYLAVTHCDKIDWLGNSRFGIPIMVKSYGKRPMDKVWSFEAECLSESRKLQ